MSFFTNWLKASPAIVTNRDGSRMVVSAFCKESDGNWLCFHWPFRTKARGYTANDCGFSVNPRYIQFLSGAGTFYVWLAAKVAAAFPKWVEI